MVDSVERNSLHWHNLLGDANPFLHKKFFPVVKGVGFDFLEFAVTDIAEVVRCGKSFKSAARGVREGKI